MIAYDNLIAFRESRGVTYEGLIGTPLLNDRVLQLDFDARSIRILKSHYTDGEETVGRFWLAENIPGINLRLPNRKIEEVLVDSGNAYPMTLPREVIQKLRPGIEYVELNAPVSEKGFLHRRRLVLREIEFRGFQLEDVECEEAIFPTIGMPLLSRFRVTIDYPKKLLYLKPREGLPERDAPDAAGLRLKRNKQGTFLRDLYLDGAAYKAGLRADDRIVTLDGQAVDKTSFGDLYDRLSRGGERVEFVVERSSAHGKPSQTERKRFVFVLQWPIPWPPVWPEKPVVKKPIPLD